MILRYLASIYTNYAAKSPKSRGRICTFGDVLTCSKGLFVPRYNDITLLSMYDVIVGLQSAHSRGSAMDPGHVG